VSRADVPGKTSRACHPGRSEGSVVSARVAETDRRVGVPRHDNRRRPRAGALLSSLAPLFLAGCASSQSQSALHPAGTGAGRIAGLWWLYFWVCAVVFVLVMFVLFVPFLRRRGQRPDDAPIINPDPARERAMTGVVWAAVFVTTVTLFVLMIGDFVTGRAIHSLGRGRTPAITIRLTGHQWWWEVQYTDWAAQYGEPYPSNGVTTANELHVPVGQPVKVELVSHDVIHSFWVPNLGGKKDLIPGHPATTVVRADRAGTFYGQCAEFCGLQHGNMRLMVVAEEPNAFRAWLDAQRQPAPQPSNDVQKRGQRVFMASTCATCHQIQGTNAGGRFGPDLTHVAGRGILAAGAVPNTRGHRAGWIVDPQRLKPGCRMPQNNLRPEDLNALLEYIDTLK
jgi:cytochrome c oxidase subunit II